MSSNVQTNDSGFSASGRFGRLSYAAWMGLSSLIAVLLLSTYLIKYFFPSSPIELNGIFIPIIYIVFLYFSIVFTIRRLHDRNQAGWLSLLILVPFANLIFMIYLYCAKGMEGSNNFGTARETKGWEKILGWIYIIFIPLSFVLGIVAAISIPAYQDYVQRAQQTSIEIQQQAEQNQ